MISDKYFNKGVKALDAADIGHVVGETPYKIVKRIRKNKDCKGRIHIGRSHKMFEQWIEWKYRERKEEKNKGYAMAHCSIYCLLNTVY